jgi:CxxC-x17-CxxC domain-containing protein
MERRGGFGGGRSREGGYGGGRGGGFNANRPMFKATCADCGNECEVPFEPREGRPVYCRDCYQKHKKF